MRKLYLVISFLNFMFFLFKGIYDFYKFLSQGNIEKLNTSEQIIQVLISIIISFIFLKFFLGIRKMNKVD